VEVVFVSKLLAVGWILAVVREVLVAAARPDATGAPQPASWAAATAPAFAAKEHHGHSH